MCFYWTLISFAYQQQMRYRTDELCVYHIHSDQAEGGMHLWILCFTRNITAIAAHHPLALTIHVHNTKN